MYLNIILTILTLVLLSILSISIYWWRKYGKKIFNSVNSLDNISSSIKNFESLASNLNNQKMSSIQNQMSQLEGFINLFK
jgi:hypothetical protein